MANNPTNKEAWLRLLKQTSIPSFNASIQTLSSAEEYSSSHSSELARTILKDPSLTTSVLKLANSAHFNRHGQAIRTISRSILVLGHKSIKEVCASCLLMDQFLKQGSSDKLQALLARAFHGAVQAKEIALLHGQKATEEIFISALLLNLGEISIYSSIHSNNSLAVQLSENYPLAKGQEREFIGCYFNDLTLALCKNWNIAPMISEMLGGKYAEDSPLRSILLGNSFASACEIKGFDYALEAHLKSLTRYTSQSAKLISENLIKAAVETQKSLIKFGIEFNVKLNKSEVDCNANKNFEIKIDRSIQLDVIQELSFVVQEKIEINEVLLQILEGLQRGGGFETSLVALLNPERNRITAKHIISSKDESFKNDFNFNINLDIPEIKQKIMTNKMVLSQNELRAQSATTIQILKRTGNKNAIWGPLIVENKVIGVFYANNNLEGSPITTEQKEAFQLFVYQASFFLHKLK